MASLDEVRARSRTAAVEAMYSAYPYPSPVAGRTPIFDVANGMQSIFGDSPLKDRTILDAGCGSGQRLLGMALRYPQAKFVGIDMTSTSLAVARHLLDKHDVRNVDLQKADLSSMKVSKEFDVVVSSGVIHHLADPAAGLKTLSSAMTDNGFLIIWLYHAIGEYERLMAREMLLLMVRDSASFEDRVETMKQLQLHLEADRYGSSASQHPDEVSQLSLDVDAFLHPIVRAYRFNEAIELLRSGSLLQWAAINSVNMIGQSKLLDLCGAESGDLQFLCQSGPSLFGHSHLRETYLNLSTPDKLRVFETLVKPTGFSMLAGKTNTYDQLGARIGCGVIRWQT
jgi:trans-aconitate methyltransferase